MTVRSKRLVPVHGWLYAPAASGPIGGGLIKLGHGSNWAAITVGVAPYAICALLYSVFMIGYLAAVLRYLFTGPAGQQSMERLIQPTPAAVTSKLRAVPAGGKVLQPTGTAGAGADAADAGARSSGAGAGTSVPPWSRRNGG